MKIESILEQRFAPDPTVILRRVAGEIILVPGRTRPGEQASLYSLNEVSCAIWTHLDGEKRVADVRDAIVAEFDVKPEEAEEDLIGFLLQLEEVGAVQRVGCLSDFWIT